MHFDEREQIRIQDDAVFDDFTEPANNLPSGKRIEKPRIRPDENRLVKRSYHVLSQRVIDRGLPANRAVDLREQGCWYLNKGQSPLIRGGDKSREIPNDSSPQCHHGRFSAYAVLQHGGED